VNSVGIQMPVIARTRKLYEESCESVLGCFESFISGANG